MIARVLLCLWLWCAAASACAVNQLAAVPLEVVDGVILAPVMVNGIPGSFALDTGAAMSVVTPDAVARFGLVRDEWAGTTILGVGGMDRHRNAIPRSITLGGVALHRNSLARDASLGVTFLPRNMAGGRQIDGLLGRDFLSVFDLDIDVPGRALKLYSVRDCRGRFLPWTGDYRSVPVESPAANALLVPVALDGVPLWALLDSGASATVVAAPGMARLSLNVADLSGDPARIAGGIGPHTVTMRQHQFHQFQIAGETMAEPVFLVAPIRVNPISDLVLGSDWLLPRHIWISWPSHQLFVAK